MSRNTEAVNKPEARASGDTSIYNDLLMQAINNNAVIYRVTHPRVSGYVHVFVVIEYMFVVESYMSCLSHIQGYRSR